MKLTIRPLTPDRWPALEDLFGENGACNGCWCTYWRIGSTYRKRPREQNKAAFREVVKRGPPPGLFAFDGEVAVGWCQLTPRDALPWLDHTWRLKRVDVVPVSSLSCFYVRKGYRKRGVASALIAAALNAAKRVNAPALEACPLDADLTPSASGTGYASTFARRIQDGGSPPAASPDYAPRPQGNVGMHPDHPGSKRRRPNKLAGELRKELVTASRDGKVARACPQ